MKLTILVTTLALAFGGCAADTAYVTSSSPPAVQDEVVSARPGYFWVHGHWLREGSRWIWHGGFYERERPGYTYREGTWSPNGHSFVWVEGGWRAQG